MSHPSLSSKERKNGCWRGCRSRARGRSLMHCPWDCSLGQPLRKSPWRLLTKTRLDWPSSNPSTPCFIIALQERPQRHLHICVCCCISHNGEGTEVSCTPMEMRRKQMWKADMSELWSARKKNEVMSFTRMERHQVKQSKPDSDRYYILLLRI